MYNKTIADWLFERNDEFLGICARKWPEIALTIVFLLTVSRGRRFWMTFLAFLNFCWGLANLFYPQHMAQAVTNPGEVDEVHLLITREVGVMIIIWCIGYWFLSKSTDSTTETSLVWAYTVMAGCMLMAQGYFLTHQPKKSKVNLEVMETNFYGSLLVTLGTVFHAIRSKDWGGYGEMSSHANLHLRVDFVLLMMMGLMSYALPQWVIRVIVDVEMINSGHAFLCRVCGTFVMGMALMANRSANFLRKSDRESVVLSHWLMYVVMALFAWYVMYTKWATLTWAVVPLLALSNVVCVMNATGALDIDPSVFSRILVPKVMSIPQDIKSMFQFRRF